MNRALPLFAALILAACGPSPAPEQSATPLEATVILMGQTSVLDVESGQIIVQDIPVCHGIAVGQFEILTAAHCMRSADAYFADQATWEHTADGKAHAVLQSTTGDLAVLRPDVALSAWVGVAAPADGPADFLHLRGTHVVAEPVTLAGSRLDVLLVHEDSGAPLVQDGLAVGVVVSCDEVDGETCLPSGGEFVRADGGSF